MVAESDRVDAEILPGCMVEIARGTVVFSTHPRRSRWIAARTLRVTVVRVGPGAGMAGAEGVMGPPAAAWIGSGGYWCEAELRDLRRIAAAPSDRKAD